MSQIQSSVGLITGLPILDTVDQLIALSARPRDLLKSRNKGLQTQQVAVSQLATRLLGLRFEVSKLKLTTVFQSRKATSSNSDLLSASIPKGSIPSVGRFTFTPVQTASAQQFLSTSLGGGSSAEGLNGFSFQFGGFLDADIPLERLNGGAGVAQGHIRITDRSGASAIVDLRFARSVDDVLDAINAHSGINVTAVAQGDRFQLIDHSSRVTGNLIVEEVEGGRTAADLGLAGIDVDTSTATGNDILYLHENTLLDRLNDGRGVVLHAGTADLEVTLRDGTKLKVDLGPAKKIGDVLNALNAASPLKLRATIAEDGDHLQLIDLTSGSGGFSVQSVVGGTAAEDLGFAGPSFGGTIASSRLQAGLKSTLLNSLQGGQGVGNLGVIQLTDRSGKTATVDLLPAETVDDVVAAINNSGVGIRASLNAARNGILLKDTTGSTSGNLIVTSGDATQTAETLNIAIDAGVSEVQSQSLGKQVIGRGTLLADFAGGVKLGSFRIEDSNGKVGAVRLNDPAARITTIGGVLDAINALTIDVEARINDRGDGILLVDRGNGSKDLKVSEVGSGKAAAGLRLTGSAARTSEGNLTVQSIDGSTLKTVDVARHLSLASIGTGVQLGKFTIRDSSGKVAEINLAASGKEAQTLGDVLDAINAADVAVDARINDTGDGLLLVDTAGGESAFEVIDATGKTTAKDLGIAGKAQHVAVGDVSPPILSGKFQGKDGTAASTVQVINGAGTFDSSDVDAKTLARISADINERQVGISATTFFDGAGYRLSISVNQTGAGRELLIDSTGGALRFDEVAGAQDALIFYGVGTSGGVLLSSATNTFEGVVDGLNLTVKGSSDTPVSVSVTTSDEPLLNAVEQFVEAYNSIREDLANLTSFNEVDGTTGVLFGSYEALRIDTDLANLVTSRFLGLGSFASLAEIGVEIDDSGQLSLNRVKLQEAFVQDSQSLESLFTDPDHGIAIRFEKMIDQLAGEDTSLLARRTEALDENITSNNRRIEVLDARLESERERLLKQFFAVEEIVARMQADLAAIQGLQALQPLSVSLGQRN